MSVARTLCETQRNTHTLSLKSGLERLAKEGGGRGGVGVKGQRDRGRGRGREVVDKGEGKMVVCGQRSRRLR